MAFPAFNKKTHTRKEHKACFMCFLKSKAFSQDLGSVSNTWEGRWEKTVKCIWLPGVFAALLFPLHFTIARHIEILGKKHQLFGGGFRK